MLDVTPEPPAVNQSFLPARRGDGVGGREPPPEINRGGRHGTAGVCLGGHGEPALRGTCNAAEMMKVRQAES